MGPSPMHQILRVICMSLLTLHALCADDQSLTLTEGPTDQVFIEGSSTDEVRFACSTTGNPKPEITWIRNDIPLSEDYSRDYSEEGSTYLITEEGELVINSPTRFDQGQLFRCEARNTFGALLSQEATLEIVYVDTSSDLINPTTVNADDELCLPCNPPNAYPGVQFKWMKRISAEQSDDVRNSDRLMSLPDGELCFAFADTEDAGEYSCLVASSHDLGQNLQFQRSSIVDFVVDRDTTEQATPEQIYGADNVTVHRGQTAVLQCFFRGRPLPVYQWSKSGQPLDPAVMTGVGSHEVTIPNAQPHHSGVYTCNARVRDRSETSTVRLTVKSPPLLTTHLSDTDVRFLSDVSFECASDAPDDEYAWYYNADPIQFDEADGRIHQSQNVLNIERVTWSDSGVYQCSVSNQFDAVLSTAQLRVRDISSTTVPPRRTVKQAVPDSELPDKGQSGGNSSTAVTASVLLLIIAAIYQKIM